MTHIAQLNIGRFRYATDDSRMRAFMDNLDRVNAIAERTEGFIWRLKDESNNATAIRPAGDPAMAVNLSVWESVEALERFVWATVHKQFYNRKAEWFERPEFCAFCDVAGREGIYPRPRRSDGAARSFAKAWRERLRLRLESPAAYQAMDEPEMRMSGMRVARVEGAMFNGVAVADGLAYCRAGCWAERA